MAAKNFFGFGEKAQVAVEFFLVLGFALTLLSVLVANSEAQLAQNSLLDKSVLSRAALDSLTTSINFVFLQGNNSRVRAELFVPTGVSGSSNATCFFNFSNSLSCYVGDPQGRQVYSRNLLVLPSSVGSNCFSSGWKEVLVENRDNNIYVSCTSIA